MRMVLETLFNKINELNEIHELIGCENLYGIKFSGSTIESNFDCFDEVYTDLTKFRTALEKESYIENIDNAIVETMETARELYNIQFDVTFDVKIPGQERSKCLVYAYLTEI